MAEYGKYTEIAAKVALSAATIKLSIDFSVLNIVSMYCTLIVELFHVNSDSRLAVHHMCV